MNYLAAVFAGISLLAAPLGFAMDVLPILALLGKMAALIALVAFAITATAYVLEEWLPLVNFDAADIHP